MARKKVKIKKYTGKIDRGTLTAMADGVLKEHKDSVWRRNFFIILSIFVFGTSFIGINFLLDNIVLSFLLSCIVFPLFWMYSFFKNKHEQYFNITGHVFLAGQRVEIREVGIFDSPKEIAYKNEHFNRGHLYSMIYSFAKYALWGLCLLGLYALYKIFF